MAKNAHVQSAEAMAGQPLTNDMLIDLSTQLAIAGATQPSVDVARIAYKRGEDEGDDIMAGYAASLGSYVATRGNLDHGLALELGEQSQESLPADRIVGNKYGIRNKAVALRSSGALGLMFRNWVPAAQRPDVIQRATDLLDEDLSVNAGFKLGIARAINGRAGNRLAITEVKRGFTDAWSGVPDTNHLDRLKYTGRELTVSAFALGMVGTQTLGRAVMPMRPLQRALAGGLSTKVNLRQLPAGREVVALPRA